MGVILDNGKENANYYIGFKFLGFGGYSSSEVDRRWGMWRSDYNMPKAVFYLLKGDYSIWGVVDFPSF